MNANQDVKSSIERQLSSVNMSQDRRQQVLHDVGIAESIVAAVEWVCGKFKRPNADVFAKPSPKDRELPDSVPASHGARES